MSRLLFLIPLVAIIELVVLIQVGQVIGLLPTILIIIGTGVTGAWLLRKQGLQMLRQAQIKAQAGELPARELIEGLLMLFGGVLLMTPGFVTDICGMLLILPPTRALLIAGAGPRVGAAAMNRFASGRAGFTTSRQSGFDPTGRAGPAPGFDSAEPRKSQHSGIEGEVIEGEFTEVDKR